MDVVVLYQKDYQSQGADEVRRASIAFLRMRERIERQIEQRTMMLSGVSHDLRTILTRFKLQLALVNTDFDIKPLEQDVSDMQNMLEDYLAFARGEGSESVKTFDLNALMQKFSADAHLHKRQFSYTIEGPTKIQACPYAFTRLVSNLVSNAFRYVKTVKLTAVSKQESFIMTIDDDGPGIHKNMRIEVFKPFFRLDKARNQDASGTGLGLSIAQDIARSHGGNIQLDDSPLGGLRATLDIPL
ncbi:two-component system osmolarity sensor histidine kinase EnvZ [Bartonella doshiae]|nr:two-component system osmolarity sensor histidine kinase EnvZ [Bartonella doshiae]